MSVGWKAFLLHIRKCCKLLYNFLINFMPGGFLCWSRLVGLHVKPQKEWYIYISCLEQVFKNFTFSNEETLRTKSEVGSLTNHHISRFYNIRKTYMKWNRLYLGCILLRRVTQLVEDYRQNMKTSVGKEPLFYQALREPFIYVLAEFVRPFSAKEKNLLFFTLIFR